jgi:hypothetical protein
VTSTLVVRVAALEAESRRAEERAAELSERRERAERERDELKILSSRLFAASELRERDEEERERELDSSRARAAALERSLAAREQQCLEMSAVLDRKMEVCCCCCCCCCCFDVFCFARSIGAVSRRSKRSAARCASSSTRSSNERREWMPIAKCVLLFFLGFLNLKQNNKTGRFGAAQEARRTRDKAERNRSSVNILFFVCFVSTTNNCSGTDLKMKERVWRARQSCCRAARVCFGCFVFLNPIFQQNQNKRRSSETDGGARVRAQSATLAGSGAGERAVQSCLFCF